MDELKPCPFCGKAAMLRKALWPSDGCTDAVIHAEPGECGMTGFDIGTTDEGVIAAWNRRAALSSQCAAGEAEYQGRAFVDGSWLPWHSISVEVYENRQKWPRDGYEVRASPLPVHQQKGEGGLETSAQPQGEKR